jgi:hypothetical protein
MADLISLLGNQPLTKAPSKASLKAFLADMTYDAEDPTSQNDRAFVWYSMGNGIKPVDFARRGRPLIPVGHGRDHGPVGHIDADLAGKETTVQLMAAFAVALRQTTNGQGGVLLDWRQDRRHISPKGLVAPMGSGIAVVAPADENAAFDLARLRRVVDHVDTHKRFDSFAAANYLKKYFDAWGSTPFQFEFAMTPKDTGKPTAIAHDMSLEIIGTGAKRRLRLSFDTDVVDETMALAIKKAFVKALTSQPT